MKIRRTRRLLPVLACLVAVAHRPTDASLVRECDFVTLVTRAQTIFHGKCLARREVADGQPLPYTEYTFEILAAARGATDAGGAPLRTITFRHAGTRTPRQRADGLEEVPLRLGLPEYEVGEEAVLFLSRPSAAGLCAPIGLEQGRFTVVRRDGRALVKNDRGRRLFERAGEDRFAGLAAAEKASLAADETSIDLKCFLGLCSKLKSTAQEAEAR